MAGCVAKLPQRWAYLTRSGADICLQKATICAIIRRNDLASGRPVTVRRTPVEKMLSDNGDDVKMKEHSLSAKDLNNFRQSYFIKVSPQVEKIREDNKRAYEDARHVVLA